MDKKPDLSVQYGSSTMPALKQAELGKVWMSHLGGLSNEDNILFHFKSFNC